MSDSTGQPVSREELDALASRLYAYVDRRLERVAPPADFGEADARAGREPLDVVRTFSCGCVELSDGTAAFCRGNPDDCHRVEEWDAPTNTGFSTASTFLGAPPSPLDAAVASLREARSHVLYVTADNSMASSLVGAIDNLLRVLEAR